MFNRAGNVLAAEKILRIAHTNGLESLDPAMSIDHRTAMFLRAVYDSLVDYVPGNWPQLENKLAENISVFVEQVRHAKPSGVKGNFVNSITIAGTMTPGVKVSM